MPEHEDTTRRQRRRHVVGSTLIVLGLVLFFMRLVGGPSDTVVFFTVGGVFLAWYLHNRSYGLLIPACILLGLGVGRVGDYMNLNVDDPQKLGLGLGFVAILVIDMMARERSPWWPVIPGAILIVGGVGMDFGPADWVRTHGLPLILVVVGLMFVAGIIGKKPRQ